MTTNEEPTDAAWLAWYEQLKRATELQGKGDLQSAIGVIDEYLGNGPAPDLRADALSFRAILLEDLGDLTAAKRDFIAAQPLSKEASFVRYTIELCLADICERLQQPTEARAWYVSGLATVVGDPSTSGGSAIRRLILLVGEDALMEEERRLCMQAARQAWKHYGLAGDPDLTRLLRTAEILSEAERTPPSRSA